MWYTGVYMKFFTPSAHAQGDSLEPPEFDGGLAPQCGWDCGCEHVLQLFFNFYKLLIWASTLLIAVALIYVGATFALNALTAGELNAHISRAKTILKASLLGLIIVLCAGLIVEFIFTTLTEEGTFEALQQKFCPEAGGQ